MSTAIFLAALLAELVVVVMVASMSFAHWSGFPSVESDLISMQIGFDGFSKIGFGFLNWI